MVINSFSLKIIDSSSLKKTRFCEKRMLEKLTIKILNNFISKSTHHRKTKISKNVRLDDKLNLFYGNGIGALNIPLEKLE
jgi:hypothetical protein